MKFGKKKHDATSAEGAPARYKQNPYDHLVLQESFAKGMDAKKDGLKRNSNPYDERFDSMLLWQWDAGWVAMDRHLWKTGYMSESSTSSRKGSSDLDGLQRRGEADISHGADFMC